MRTLHDVGSSWGYFAFHFTIEGVAARQRTRHRPMTTVPCRAAGESEVSDSARPYEAMLQRHPGQIHPIISTTWLRCKEKAISLKP